MCRHCHGGKCYDPPTPANPAEIDCTACNGDGCELCKTGRLVIDGCPKRMIPGEIWTVLRAVNWAEKGMWPTAGGLMDQSHSFLTAMELVLADDAAWRNSRQANGK
jgi:hypothetical protein